MKIESCAPPSRRCAGKRDAAWEELALNGYSNLTIEAVASRARTSCAVLRRRWPDRGQLAAAAIRQLLADHPVLVPEEGILREQLLSCMKQTISRGMPVLMLASL